MIALISLYIIAKSKEKKPQRKVYTRVELLNQNKSANIPTDWSPIPTAKVEEIIEAPPSNEDTLESFILKEIEISVKELDKKRVPFSNIDKNILRNKLNPSVQEFLPKVRLNPLAQDFHPFQ